MKNKRTSDFKIEIGTKFKDDKRDITIIDKEYRDNPYNKGKFLKYYKYQCNKCGWEEGWVEENHLIGREQGCSCCRGLVVVEGINDIPTTAPWMVKYFQGGYDEAKLYTKGCSKKIYPICPDCGRVKNKQMRISEIYNQHSIGCSCSDGNSMCEKLMFNVLEQLNLNFGYHKIFNWSKNVQVDNPRLCGRKEYDFCFEYNNEQYIVETHGGQHYTRSFAKIKSAKTLEEEKENDRIKKELALANGIKETNYIVIDCRESDFEWIREHIAISNLAKIYNFDKIDWLKCHEFSCSSRVKEVCNLWNIGHSVIEICEITKLSSKSTIRKYLKNGTELGYCKYDPIEEHRKGSIKGLKNRYSNKNFELSNNDSSFLLKNKL